MTPYQYECNVQRLQHIYVYGTQFATSMHGYINFQSWIPNPMPQTSQGIGSDVITVDRCARVDVMHAWLRSLVEPSLRKFSAFGAKQLPVNRAFDHLNWEGVSDVTEVRRLRSADWELSSSRSSMLVSSSTGRASLMSLGSSLWVSIQLSCKGVSPRIGYDRS